MAPPKVHFKWMNAYWSCSQQEWDRLLQCTEENEPFDLTENCRELKSRPKGQVKRLKDGGHRIFTE